MHAVLENIIGILLVFFAIATADQIRRSRVIDSRIKNICRLADHGLRESVLAMKAARLLRALFQWLGYSPGDRKAYVYLLFIAVAGPIALLAGWKAAAGLAVILLAVRLGVSHWRRALQKRKFADGLPRFLERVHRLVMIGNTLPQAFVEAVGGAESIVKEQIEPVVRRINHGVSFPDSVETLAQHVDIIELHMLTAYVRTNAKFGGRVAHTLNNLVNQLKNRRRLEQEVHAATAETRTSAVILFGLTVFTIAAVSIMSPQHLHFFLRDQTGLTILAAILCWPLVGALIMRKILVLDF